MKFYFASGGRKVEEMGKITALNSLSWGILLSFKDIRTKDKRGSSRFRKLTERKKKIE